MGINFRFARRLILLLLFAGVAWVIVVIAANLILWRRHDAINAERLKTLQAESILRCRVDKITPWHEKEEISADLAGTTHGIGFGGRALTSVTRMFSLNDADPANVISAFATCAESSGWTLAKQPYVALSGTKAFPKGWTAYLRIYLESHPPFAGQPIVQVSLSADPI